MHLTYLLLCYNTIVIFYIKGVLFMEQLIDFVEFKDVDINAININSLDNVEFYKFCCILAFKELAKMSGNKIMLTGGLVLSNIFGTDRLTYDIDLNILLTSQDINNCIVENKISKNKIDNKKKSIFKIALEDVKNHLLKNINLNSKMKIEIKPVFKQSKQKLLTFTRLKDNLEANIKIDGIGVLKKEDLKERIDIKNITFFNKPSIIVVLNPYSMFFNKIHRLRKFDMSLKIEYYKYSDFYDLYMIKKLYPGAKNWIELELKMISEIFEYDETPRKSIKQIEKNISFIKKNISNLFPIFYNQLNQMLISA